MGCLGTVEEGGCRGGFIGSIGVGRVFGGEICPGQWRRLERVAAGPAWELPTRFALVRRAILLPMVGYAKYKAMSL